MEVESLHILVEVARAGSFAAVARARGLDPSSVSRTVAALETELGARLFQRSTRALSLTEAGERYLGTVAPLLEGLDEAREALRAEPRDPVGTVRLTASVAFGEMLLAPLLPAIRARFPRLRLELILADANLDLVAERIDVAIRLAPTYRADVIGAKLFPTRYRVVASRAYLAKRGAPVRPAELTGRSCILSAVPEFRSRWLFRPAGASATEPEEVLVRGDLVSSNAIVLRAAVRGGLGPALLADWLVADDLATGRLVDLFPDHAVTATSFETAAWLLYPSRQHLPARVRHVIDFLKSELARA
ncbi:MAG: LysR family transcriptional regulator [Methylobacteriaceae bacterium]|nr:LysR family transcriptional regulator [Methylobacteriaceae bacterium]